MRISSWMVALVFFSGLTLDQSGDAAAHGPAPAPLEVLKVNSDSGRAALIRTNIGLAEDYPPLGWTYVCPSQWGEREQARAAHLSGQKSTLMVGGGEVFRSNGDVCSFELLSTDGAWYPLDVHASREGFWIPARSLDTEGASGIFWADSANSPTRIHTWMGEERFRCDSLISFETSEQEGLIGAGAEPEPALWWASGKLNAPGELTWRKESLDTLAPDTTHIELRHRSDEGLLWLVAATPSGRVLWRGENEQGSQGMTWSAIGGPAQTILGPVWLGELGLIARDGVLETSTDGLNWTIEESVSWTCLKRSEDWVLACTLSEVFRLSRGTQGLLETEQVFDMRLLMAPLEGCPSHTEGQQACESDWIHFGGEVGLLDPTTLTTPKLAPDASGESEGESGCLGGHPRASTLLLLGLILSFALRHRRALKRRALRGAFS